MACKQWHRLCPKRPDFPKYGLSFAKNFLYIRLPGTKTAVFDLPKALLGYLAILISAFYPPLAFNLSPFVCQ